MRLNSFLFQKRAKEEDQRSHAKRKSAKARFIDNKRLQVNNTVIIQYILFL